TGTWHGFQALLPGYRRIGRTTTVTTGGARSGPRHGNGSGGGGRRSGAKPDRNHADAARLPGAGSQFRAGGTRNRTGTSRRDSPDADGCGDAGDDRSEIGPRGRETSAGDPGPLYVGLHRCERKRRGRIYERYGVPREAVHIGNAAAEIA